MAPAADPASTVWPRRMIVVHGFARHMTGIDPATEVPPVGLIPSRQRWRPPFLFTPGDIERLVAAASAVIRWRLPAATHSTLIGLLAATGMRIGEALKLDDDDIDWDDGVLLVRESKFGKSRIVPLDPSTVAALRSFVATRDGLVAAAGARRVRLDPRDPDDLCVRPGDVPSIVRHDWDRRRRAEPAPRS